MPIFPLKLSQLETTEKDPPSACQMPKRKNSATHRQLPTPLRRSPRLLLQKGPQYPNAQKPKKTPETCPPKSTKKSTNFNKESIFAIPADNSAKPPIFNDGVESFSYVRRSQRLSLLGNAEKIVKSNNSSSCESKKRSFDAVENKCRETKGVLANKVKDAVGVGRSERRSNVGVKVVLGLKAANEYPRDVCEKREQVVKVVRKRQNGEEGNKGCGQGWTKEQEMALQRAYFAAKPTPNFWKKVSKLVPGKSAQECFDKVHSDHITPPQNLPRSRAKRINSSPIECFSLSASKLLRPSKLGIKRLSGNKQKSHVVHKTVRELLQKHNRMDQDYDADLFSVLEPNLNPSTEYSQLNVVLSTPKNLQEKQGFLQKCCERSYSGHKKRLSRFSGSCGMDLVSPPVLKQVKNKALHERYIDQLHCREAKRKAAYKQAGKSIEGKENRGQINAQKVDLVRAAKNALVSDVRDAVNQLQCIRANTTFNSSDFDNASIESNDDEGEKGI